jgi:hypothetical protein
MKEKIDQLLAEIDTLTAQTAEQAEELRIKYLSKCSFGKAGSVRQFY